jgi:hypothetical protein
MFKYYLRRAAVELIFLTSRLSSVAMLRAGVESVRYRATTGGSGFLPRAATPTLPYSPVERLCIEAGFFRCCHG